MDNKFFVGIMGENKDVVTLLPVPSKMTKEQALNLAGWIVALASDMEEFAEVYREVCNT